MPTPTPWLDTGMFVESAEGGVIASVQEGEDRRFVVRACNAHDDLVKAVERWLSWCDDWHAGKPHPSDDLEFARKALTKARS